MGGCLVHDVGEPCVGGGCTGPGVTPVKLTLLTRCYHRSAILGLPARPRSSGRVETLQLASGSRLARSTARLHVDVADEQTVRILGREFTRAHGPLSQILAERSRELTWRGAA
jgi:hypothetical protein